MHHGLRGDGRPCMHTYTRTYIHTYTHMYTHIHYTYTQTYIYTRIRAYIGLHACIHTYIYVLTCMHRSIYANIHHHQFLTPAIWRRWVRINDLRCPESFAKSFAPEQDIWAQGHLGAGTFGRRDIWAQELVRAKSLA